MTTTTKPQENHSYTGGFNNGLKQIRVCDIPNVTMEIMEALNINNRVSFSSYKHGKIDLRISQVSAIESVFNKYGITTGIWGNN